MEKSNRQIEDLEQHLSKIQSNVSLKISNLPSKKELESALNKEISRKIKDWLNTSPKPNVKESTNVEGLIFEVLAYKSNSNNVSVDRIIYSNASNYFDVNKHIRTIKDKIICKIKKYESLSVKEKLSLNIAVAPKSLASTDKDRLKSIIENIFQTEQVINSVIVLEREGLTTWKQRIYYNSQAPHSFYLPENH